MLTEERRTKMELHEKLQSLRKERGLTQEELSEALYVSRTAISKWESGRGYPSIESLKDLASFYLVSIDDLLSSEKLIMVAERENSKNINRLASLFIGIVDILALLLIFLPLYPKTIDGYIYSVNLINYSETTQFNSTLYWILSIFLAVLGLLRIGMLFKGTCKGQKTLAFISIGINGFMVLFLMLAREPYAAVLAFAFLAIKVTISSKAIQKATNV